ncbi:helix-turn-helix transcriptional regulator [Actinoplanes sp. L3-i22]|uniref:helix-turn-helix domain-containing protein n=1 Tax=Actinoplanes sp. L3-i22 TaxID=2836373 RepID=UPI001C7564CD|nr:helix-turn-helix transcriptional regulator [Actinoplanes sp. L3-i22]BCY07549.1 transcriptional regulator [Actinoplanes sp. L3-i22]
MAGELGPISAGRKLRSILRQAREIAGLTQAEVAERMEWSLSKVARIESGDVGIGTADLVGLCRVLHLGSAVTGELVSYAEAMRVRGWWHEFRADLPPAYQRLIGLEIEADRIADYAAFFVPGLLQTTDYTEALMRSILADPPDDVIRTRVAMRVRRQQEVHDQPNPPDMVVLLDESVLYRRVGDQVVMADQIRRLMEAARRPHITMRVLPFECPGAQMESFSLVSNQTAGSAVYSEVSYGDVLFEDERRISSFQERFEASWKVALDPDRTGQLLRRVADGYERGDQPRPWLWD